LPGRRLVAVRFAEVSGRDAERGLARFLSVAAGSASEAEHHTLPARDHGCLSIEASARLDAQANETKKDARLLVANVDPAANGQQLSANG
jgi:four helix bundle protein